MALHRIVIKGSEDRGHDEYPADAALKPGYVVVLNSDGEVAKNGTLGADVPVIVAKEDALQGRTVDDAYAAGEVVMIHRAVPGEFLYLRVAAGAGAIVKGDLLTPAADGTVVKHSSTYKKMFQAEEALDNSGGSSEAFIKASVI